MRNRTSGGVILATVVLLVALVATACGGSTSDESSSSSAKSGGFDYSSLSGTLNGSGATFPKTFYEESIGGFSETAEGVTVNYNAVGSGQGKKDLAAGTSDWAGSDSTVKDEEKGSFTRPFLYFPTTAAPITVSFNVDQINKLQLSPATVAKIFMGVITKWNDPAIAAENPKESLPDLSITVAVRSDGSGTTSNFSKYLAAAAPEVFTIAPSDTIAWPNATAARGNAGVAQIVQTTPGAIGYVDFSDANVLGLSFAAIRNKAGAYVWPSVESASAAIAGAELRSDLTYNPLNAAGEEAYPITAPTYVLVYNSYGDAAKAAAIRGWLTYLLTDAQDLAPTVDFAPLPAAVRDRALAQITQISG